MTHFVVDASVVIKWVVEEEGSDSALTLLSADHALCAPDLIMCECANILWKKVSRKEINAEEAELMSELLRRAAIEAVPARSLMPSALRLACRIEHPAYDGFDLALALQREVKLVTADDRFARVVAMRGAPEMVDVIITLSDLDGL